MNIYTVCFFGHRYIERGTEISDRLDKLLHDLITQKEYVDFLIGRDGDFDLLASAAIKRAIRSYGCGNTHFTLVLPYMKAEYRDNEKEYLDYYDEVEVCAESSEAHPKSAIKPVNYEQQKKKNYRTKYGRIENMEYHEMGYIFVCKAGRILWRVGTKHEKTKTGFISEKAVYRCESCEGCPYRQNCTKAKGDKTLAVSHRFRELRAESQKNITTEFGTQLRMNRSIQAEGAFGVLKQDYGFRRFLCRGSKNIKTEFLLLGLAYNIKKLFAKVSGNRTGISLFELKTA